MNLFYSKTRRNRAQKRSLRRVNDDLSTVSTQYLDKRGLLHRSQSISTVTSKTVMNKALPRLYLAA